MKGEKMVPKIPKAVMSFMLLTPKSGQQILNAIKVVAADAYHVERFFRDDSTFCLAGQNSEDQMDKLLVLVGEDGEGLINPNILYSVVRVVTYGDGWQRSTIEAAEQTDDVYKEYARDFCDKLQKELTKVS